MFFLKDSAIDFNGNEDPCKRLYTGQLLVQRVFVVVSVLCIPVMLFTKPAILYYENYKRSTIGVRLNNPTSDSRHLSVNGENGDHKSNGHGSNVITLEEETHEKVN